MESKKPLGLALWLSLTIFVSAFLLFQVQPLISKFILPWFGGSPAVWTTAMLFFLMHPLLGVRLFPSLGKSAQAFGSGQTACGIACIGVDHGDLCYSD